MRHISVERSMSEGGMNDAASEEPESSVPAEGQLGPGATLAAQRQALGWSVEEVAAKLKLAPRQIACIEADNYNALPGISIVTGFVRAYAKVLKLEPAPLIAQLPREESIVSRVLPIKQELATPFSETRLRASGKMGAPSRRFALLLSALLLGVAIFGAQQFGLLAHLESSPQLDRIKSNGSGTVAQDTPRDPLPGASKVEQESQAVPAVEKTEEGAKVSNPPSVEVKESAPLPAAAVVAAPVEPQVVANSAPANTAGQASAENRLVLQMREDSWIEVKRAGGGIIVSRVVKAGDSETITINEPVILTVGNVHGVDATLRGAPLELKAGKANTARLQLK
jgi:cytoskeleton protein RodZ